MDFFTLALLAGGAYLLFKKSQPSAAKSSETIVADITGPGAILPAGIIQGDVINGPTTAPIVDTESNYEATTIVPGTENISLGQIFGANPPPQIVSYDAATVEQGAGGYSPSFIRTMVESGAWDSSVLDHFWYWAKLWAQIRGDSGYPAYGGANAYLETVHQGLFRTPYQGD